MSSRLTTFLRLLHLFVFLDLLDHGADSAPKRPSAPTHDQDKDLSAVRLSFISGAESEDINEPSCGKRIAAHSSIRRPRARPFCAFLPVTSQLTRPVFLSNSLIKECEYYKREVKENQQQLEQMVQEGRDPYDIKKFREVLGESEMMVPDSARRMQQAVLDLQSFVQDNQDLEGEWQEPARRILLDYAPETSKGVDHGDCPRVVETNVSDLADGDIF